MFNNLTFPETEREKETYILPLISVTGSAMKPHSLQIPKDIETMPDVLASLDFTHQIAQFDTRLGSITVHEHHDHYANKRLPPVAYLVLIQHPGSPYPHLVSVDNIITLAIVLERFGIAPGQKSGEGE